MIDYDFQFTMNLTAADPGGQMLGEVMSAVLGHVGCEDGAAVEVLRQVRHALESAIAEGGHDCTLLFNAASGQLDIVVSCGGRPPRTIQAWP